MLCHVYYCLSVCLFFIFNHDVVSLFSIYEFDCPSGIFRPSYIALTSVFDKIKRWTFIERVLLIIFIEISVLVK